MTPNVSGGNLLVGGRSNTNTPYRTFTVQFDRNVKIKNYNQNPKNLDYTTSANVINGQTTITQDRDYSDMHMSEQSYLLFNEIRKLDNNKANFSADDIELAKRNGYSISGDMNKGDGVVTIKTKDNWVIELDFETDAEKAAANKPKEKVAESTNPQPEAKEETFKDKVIGWVADFLEAVGCPGW